MSETDKTAIEIVRNLQTNIRKTTLAMVAILMVTLFGAIFWSGGINNQVKTNTETGRTNKDDIKDLTILIKDFASEQKVANSNFATDNDIKKVTEYWDLTSRNLDHISWWAKTKGYSGFPRGIEIIDTNELH